jgi:proline iminopeptidase
MSLATESARALPGGREAREPLPVVLGLFAPAIAGAITALFMPRGPVTPLDVIMSMLVGAGVGILSGWLLGRWAILAAPVVFAVFFELGRISLDAPSLEEIHFDSAFGIVLFVTTRGFHIVLALLPMVWGAALGASALRRASSGGGIFDSLPRISTIMLILSISVMSLLIARPARTDPILDEDGLLLTGSVAELTTVDLGGRPQKIMIRGNDVTNPILLYLTGGPGNSDLGYTRTFLEELEEDFVLVAWDQRGAGKSYSALDPVSTLTLTSAVSDVVDLTSYLTDRFGQEKIYVFGNSWGSIIGVLAAQQRPDLFHAYIGAGQMVNPLETDRRLYRQILEYAERNGDSELLARMTGFGEPPYADIRGYMTVIEHYGNLEPYAETAEFAGGVPGIQGTGVSEYGLMDKLNVFRGLADMGGALYPQAQSLDLRMDVPALEIPVYVIQGAHELTARSDLAVEYAATLQAPSIDVALFENSGHVPHFEEAARFHRYLVDVVLAQTRS